MCGIIGVLNHDDAFSLVKQGLKKIEERGKDAFGYYDGRQIHHVKTITQLGKLPETESDPKRIIAHNLHAIVNIIPQPLKDNRNILVSNCEIYNWKNLCTKFQIKAENDSELLLKLINKIGINRALKQIRGVYAFCYWEKDTVYLARDIVGIKPLWYSYNKRTLAFASEKKAISEFENVVELNPREILRYNFKTNKIKFLKRDYFNIGSEIIPDKNHFRKLLTDAVRIRVPDQPFGVLFSGGLDSVVIAKILKSIGCDFTCYTAATSEDATDLVAAKNAADALGLRLKYTIISKQQTEKYLSKVIPLIEDNNVVKVGVALPMFIASELARKDRCRVVFSGSGADELFAGYSRYKKSSMKTLNKDCYSDFLKIYEKNTYRDDVVTMNNNLELRVPFLDRDFVDYSLKIKPQYKLKDDIDKFILRKFAGETGIPEDIAYRKKKAAQYGSGFDRMIDRLAKDNKAKSKSDYLRSFYNTHNLKLGAMISSGKDGLFAAFIMQRQNYDVSCFITIRSRNESSFMFHTPAIDLASLQAEAVNLPIVMQDTEGEKETELKDLERAIRRAKDIHKIEGIVTGALFSNYQRTRIEKVCDRLGLKVFSPLWHMDQEVELKQLLKNNFKFIMTSIAAYGLDKSWLGKPVTDKEIKKLIKLKDDMGFNCAGEGGEFESLVLDCPMFEKRIEIVDSEIAEENENTARMIIRKAELKDK